MKIEMLEQMIASYLKNCEGCLIVQTNWSPSVLEKKKISGNLKTRLQTIMDDIKANTKLNIFKKNSVGQFVGQCELDVVGIKYSPFGNVVYLYDTAFHENGLGYKNPVETVLKKIVRAFMIGDLYFANNEIRIGFVSPKCNYKLKLDLENALNDILPVLSKYNANVSIQLFLNDEFDILLNDLLDLEREIKDDNDLFIRAFKLIGTNKQKATRTSSIIKTKNKNKNIVITGFNSLIKSGKITQKLVNDLCDISYSKKTFGLSGYSVLKRISDMNVGNNKRYYADIISINGELFKICSQWYEQKGHISNFNRWVKKLLE